MSIPKTLVDKWGEELNSELNKFLNVSQFVPLDTDFRHEFQTFYQNKQFLDFEIRSTSSLEPIRVHRIYLIIKGFKSVAKCEGRVLTIEGDKDIIESIIKSYYCPHFDLKIDSTNVEEYIKIADQFGIEELANHLTKKKSEIDLFEFRQTFNDFKTSIKRKSELFESISSKRMSKPSADNTATDWKLSSSVSNDSLNTPIDFSINSDINGTQSIESNDIQSNDSQSNDIQSKDKQAINENSDAVCVKNEKKLVIDLDKEITEDNVKQNDVPIVDKPKETVTNELEKKLTTEITRFLPEEAEESKEVSLVEERVKSVTTLKPRNESNVSNNMLRRDSEKSNYCPFNYSTLINQLQSQNKQAVVARVQNQIKKDMRRRGVAEPDNKGQEMADNQQKRYEIIKFLYQNSKQKSTQVWKSRFVPKMANEDQMVAVVGGPYLNWFNLDVISKDPTLICEASHTFTSLESKSLRSMAVTVIEKPIKCLIYAIGSIGCVFILKHPEQPKVETYDTLKGFVGNDEEVTDMAFLIKCDCNLLLCGTSDCKIVIYDLKFHVTGRLNSDTSFQKLVYTTKFPIASILYVDKYDCLVASGESSDLIILKDVSTVDQRQQQIPNVGKTTPSLNKMNSISSLVYIKEYDLICFRSVTSDFLQLAQINKIMDKFEVSRPRKKPIDLTFWPGAKLKYRKCQVGSEFSEFIDIGCNGSLIACGDSFGCVYVYSCNESLKGKGIIQPMQVIEYDKWQNPFPIIRSVSISDDLKYMVSTTNINLIFVCQPSPPKDVNSNPVQ